MWISFLTLSAAVALAHGHGRVLDPPGRGTVWRLGYNARANYDDDGLNCGGFYHQHTDNGGKCGLCGDPYDSARPRAHERGGVYDSGLIVGSYEEGDIVTFTVQITAHHLGYWEFKLCPDANEPNQDCFDSNPVELEEGGTKYYPNEGSNKYYVNYRLPEGLTCENCVLQWRYTCGNNWGVCSNGSQGLGCGDQETFGACSDISIAARQVPQFIQVDSLLQAEVDQLDFVRLLLSGAMLPQRQNLIKPQTGARPQKQRLNSKKPRSKLNYIPKTRTRNKLRKRKRKKVKPNKGKWMDFRENYLS